MRKKIAASTKIYTFHTSACFYSSLILTLRGQKHVIFFEFQVSLLCIEMQFPGQSELCNELDPVSKTKV